MRHCPELVSTLAIKLWLWSFDSDLTLCAIKMDLSSLEGPALHDQRVSASVLRNIDRPRVEVTVWDGDRRGSSRSSPSHRASTLNVIQPNSATAHDRGKLAVKPQPGPGGEKKKKSSGPFRSLENRQGMEHSRSPSSAQSSILSYESPPPRQSQSHSSLPSPCGAPSEQIQSHNTVSNDHLIWLEDQQIWTSMCSPTSPVIPHTHNDSSYHLNAKPQNSLLRRSYDPRANECDSDELPPSYESHGFVQNRTVQESQWMTVAQRVGRLSLS
jgi:hypothetical protein